MQLLEKDIHKQQNKIKEDSHLLNLSKVNWGKIKEN